MNTALLSALHEIETEKGIPFETVKGVLEESLLAAYEAAGIETASRQGEALMTDLVFRLPAIGLLEAQSAHAPSTAELRQSDSSAMRRPYESWELTIELPVSPANSARFD